MNSFVCGQNKKDSVMHLYSGRLCTEYCGRLRTVDVEMSASDIGSTANCQGSTWIYFS